MDRPSCRGSARSCVGLGRRDAEVALLANPVPEHRCLASRKGLEQQAERLAKERQEQVRLRSCWKEILESIRTCCQSEPQIPSVHVYERTAYQCASEPRA